MNTKTPEVPITTIKVPASVRDQLRQRAAAQHITQGEALQDLLDQAAHPNIENIVREHMSRWKPLLDRLA